MLKNLFLLLLFLTISNCVSSSAALFGPSITAARTGSIYQAGLSYGTSKIINEVKKGLIEMKKTETILYKQIDRLQKNMEINKNSQIALKNNADLFFKAVKNNLK